MSIKERKERERKEMQELILNAATEIFKEEGLENLSIRKIANKIEYSPAIIYHYFKDKDEIINHLMRRGYGKIVEGLSFIPQSIVEPEKVLKELTVKLIEMALEIPEEYKIIQLSNASSILEHTSSLFKGASKEKPALAILSKCLKNIYKEMDDNLIELTAQIIWTSTFGLIIKLITEKNIPMEQRNNLIDHHIRCIIDSMILGKPLGNL